jgi:Kef-type K+ transport system membrane component KefB
MSEFISEYVTLAIVSILAFISPFLARSLNTPVVVTELVYGLIIGGIASLAEFFFGGNVLIFGDALRFLANLGLVLLLFLAGLEFDFQLLQERGKGPVLIGIVVFLFTFGLGALMLSMLGVGNIFVMAIIMSTTSVGVVIPTLREVGTKDKNWSQNIIISALVADFFTMLLVVFVPFAAEGDLVSVIISAGIYIPLLFLIIFAAYKIGSAAMWHFPSSLSKFFHSKDPSELGVRASFMFLFLFIIVALAFGIEAILGAFLAGILLSLLFQEGALLSKKMFGIGYGFFIPVFFIYIGSTFDFGLFGTYHFLWLVPILVLVGLANKVIPSLLYLKEHTLKKIAAMGILNSSRLTLLIAAATVALDYTLIDTSTYSALILLSIILCILSPTIFRRMSIEEKKEEVKPGD